MWIGIQVNGEHKGQVSVQVPFRVSGYLLAASGDPLISAAVKVGIGARIETGITDDEGYFQVEFSQADPGGPYPLMLNGGIYEKISVIVEEEFSWGDSSKDVFIENIEKKRSFFESIVQPQPHLVAANQIIVFFGTKGGLGTSSLTAVVARELYAQGIPVMVVEAAKSGGSLIRMFSGTPVKKGLDNLKLSADEVGETSLSPILVEIRKGLEILPLSAVGNYQGNSWTLPAAKELYRWASRRSGYVVVDAGSDLTSPLASAALWMANKIFPLAGVNPVELDAALRFSTVAHELRWTRVIPGWVVRGAGPGELETVTGIPGRVCLKNSGDWEQVFDGKISNAIKKAVRDIVEMAQVVIGGAIV